MSKSLVFAFEQFTVRTLGNSEFPLFVASDICSALGHSNHKQAIKDNVYPEDIVKAEITDRLGRVQTVNCVNESGLYALIFGSKLESAKRFKRWVTSEVLPEIRKTGRYELPRDTITVEEQYCIRKAVAYNRKRTGRHYREVYNDLYNEFRIPRYTELKREDFDKAMAFLGQTESEQEPIADEPPYEPPLKVGSVVLSPVEAENLVSFIYHMRYVFRTCFIAMYKFLATVKSPMAGRFYEFMTEMSLGMFEDLLARQGYVIKDLDKYKHWVSHKSED
ncbi:MAG: BRO family protein [Sutterella sp.]|nr:BRO family protein [Sutterella sp.]